MFPPQSSSDIRSTPIQKPLSRLDSFRKRLSEIFGKDPDSRWGTQLMRISSDMIAVCHEDLTICHHNRAFLKAFGHSSGSFRGQSMESFIPESDRTGVSEAFGEWREGHAAGMRFDASFVLERGIRKCDVRVVRSRDKRGSFFYYLVIREDAKSARSAQKTGLNEPEPFFQGLPVAAWRTDATLSVTRVYGKLWPVLGASSEHLVGKTLGALNSSRIPLPLQSIDFTDALAGMSLQTEVSHGGETFSVTVEPFLDEAGQVVGTVGLLRRAAFSRAVERMEIPPFAANTLGSRTQHHLPPWTSDGGISVVTGRVPRFADDSEGANEILTAQCFTPRVRSSLQPEA